MVLMTAESSCRAEVGLRKEEKGEDKWNTGLQIRI